MPEKLTTGIRLKQLMRDRRLRQVDILEKCAPIAAKAGVSISKSNLSQWVHDVYQPDQVRLMILSKALKVSPAWLMGFDVPMEELNDDEAAKRKEEALKWVRTEATKQERLDLLKELAEML